jgi:hypothetical protein
MAVALLATLDGDIEITAGELFSVRPTLQTVKV